MSDTDHSQDHQQQHQQDGGPLNKDGRGFKCMTPEQHREASIKGGKASAASGHGNRFTRKTAIAAARKAGRLSAERYAETGGTVGIPFTPESSRLAANIARALLRQKKRRNVRKIKRAPPIAPIIVPLGRVTEHRGHAQDGNLGPGEGQAPADPAGA